MADDALACLRTDLRLKRKLSSENCDEKGSEAKYARYESVIKNADSATAENTTQDQTLNSISSFLSKTSTSGYGNSLVTQDASSATTEDTTKVHTLNPSSSFISKASSSGYGSSLDLQSPDAKEVLKWPKIDIQRSPDDSAFEISPSLPASTFTGAPASAGCSSGIEPGTPDPSFIEIEKTKVAFPDPKERFLHFLRTNFVNLKDNLEPTVVADHLYNDGIITDKDNELIREEKYRRKRCDRLIKAIAVSKHLSKISTLGKMYDAMKKAGCAHLVTGLLSHESQQEDSDMEVNPIKIKSLLAHCDKLKEDVDPKLFIDDLVVSGVLSFSDHSYIDETPHREDAVVNLIRIILKKPETSFLPFCRALREHYADIERLLKTTNTMNALGKEQATKKLTASLRMSSQLDFRYDKTGSKITTQVKIELPDESKDVEKMIVEDNKDNPNESLAEEAMDVGGYEIDGIHFSSIRINLKSLSCQSQLRFLQRIKDEPSYLQNWIRSSLSKKSLERLAGTKTVRIEVSAEWPKCSKLSCRCKLRKESIVKNFTFLEKELKHMDKILKEFAEFPVFDEESRQNFAKIAKEKESSSTKSDLFLRRILKCKKTVCLCLLEKQLRDTKQDILLEKVLKQEHHKTAVRSRIQTKHIKRNMSYLLEEIEPTMFVNELRHLPRSDAIVEVIVSKELRLSRCRQFLEFIMKENKSLEWFIGMLQEKKMMSILRILQSCADEDGSYDYSEGIIANYRDIVDEIDARALRQTFVDQRQIKAKEFDKIMKQASRRGKGIWLVKHVLSSRKSVQRCLVDALEMNGYEHLASAIRSEKDNYRDCPRLSPLLNQGNAVTIKAEFDVKIETRDDTESSLQILLLQSLFSSHISHIQTNEKEIDKTEDTLRWVENHADKGDPANKDLDDNVDPIDVLLSPKSPESPKFGHADEGYHTCSDVSPTTSSLSTIEEMSPGSSEQEKDQPSCDSRDSIPHRSTPQALYEDISPPSSPSTVDFPTFDLSDGLVQFLSIYLTKTH